MVTEEAPERIKIKKIDHDDELYRTTLYYQKLNENGEWVSYKRTYSY